MLVIDDEIQIRRLLRVCLERNGYQVVEAATGQAGIDQAIRYQPERRVAGSGPAGHGRLAVLKRLREWSQVPVLVVSVREREDDKIAALDNGANDYITKPFSTGELLARLRVVQRYAQPSATTTVFSSGDLEVDLTTRTVKLKGRT